MRSVMTMASPAWCVERSAKDVPDVLFEAHQPAESDGAVWAAFSSNAMQAVVRWKKPRGFFRKTPAGFVVEVRLTGRGGFQTVLPDYPGALSEMRRHLR